MRHDLRDSLLAKVTAIFLSVLLGLATVFSIGAITISYEAGFYQEDNLTFEDTEIFQDMTASSAYHLAWNYLAYHDPFYQNTIQNTSDSFFVIRDSGTGSVLAGKAPGSFTYTCSYTFSTADYKDNLSSLHNGQIPDEITVELYFADYQDNYLGQNFKTLYMFYKVIYPIRDSLPVLALLSLLGFFLAITFLLCAAGHRRGHEEIVPNWQDRIPLDLYLCGVFLLGCFNVMTLSELVIPGWIQFILFSLMCLPLFLLALATLMTMATRLKMGQCWKNTVIWRLGRLLVRWTRSLWRGLWSFLHILPLTWRTVLLVVGLMVLQSLLFHLGTWSGESLLLLFVIDAVVLAGSAFFSWQLQKLKNAGQQLADGNLEEKIDTSRMFWDIKTHGENLNAIGDGMNRAVESRLKSERLKTELITNVSHDIKTPLTSIVNYVDLLKKEDLPETAREYVAVLDRQSSRLKKLTEDLVEASKASTGNIAVHLQPIVVNEIIHQAVGEYDQKLTAGKLEVIINTFEGNLSAMADSRLLWRVLDNLLSNVCKYAMAGSRVYIDLLSRDDLVVLSMKNISRDQLNISADELMERFVRGDSSRHAEGSGLGLNIAKSLMELMGGTFSLAVDGDLFKAELTLKTV